MIDYEELARVTMEAAKFHDWYSASWRPRKGGDVT